MSKNLYVNKNYHNLSSHKWGNLQTKLFIELDTLVLSLSSQAFWLRSSVVSVLISLKTDMLPQGAIRFHTYFCNLDWFLRLRKANPQVSLALQYRLVTPSLL